MKEIDREQHDRERWMMLEEICERDENFMQPPLLLELGMEGEMSELPLLKKRKLGFKLDHFKIGPVGLLLIT
jgi:hypothetical protein